MSVKDDSIVTESSLRFYYENFCPIKDLARWISYEDPNVFMRREISFTYQRGAANDISEIYLRWQSFDGFEKFYQTLCELDSVPFKFDIGAIYSKKISLMQLSVDFKPVERELVFDIDMDDYDEFRTCCTEKKVCKKCWRYIKIAVELITETLKEDFGFKDILWVYSGRRGIHCWVCDKAARELPSEGRVTIIEYLSLISEGYTKKANLYSCETHPLVLRAFDICYGNFKDLLVEQEFFKSKTHLQTLMDYIPEKRIPVRKLVQTAIDGKVTSSLEFFNELCESINVVKPGEYHTKGSLGDYPSFLMEIVIAFSYPRLDVNVTKDIGHLLKSPFCVHAKTGRICVPVDYENMDKFHPEKVPTLETLEEHYNKGGDVENSPISQYLRYFREKFLSKCLINSRLGNVNGVDF